MLIAVEKEGRLTSTRVAALIGLGLFAGLFSGLFGVGGGMIIVPGLVVVLRVDHKLAVGTSAMAIVPACTVSLISYVVQDAIEGAMASISGFIVAGLVLAVGAVVGAQIGARLLGVISRRAAQWVFVAFAAVMIVQMMLVVPNRGGVMVWNVGSTIGVIVLGLVAGILSGLLGIGGGAIVVPVMMLAFGVSDLIAKGSSLVMMLPGVLSGLVGHLRAHRVFVRAGLIIGVSAIVTGPLGSWIAHALPEDVANYLFAAYLAFVVVMMVREALHKEPDVPKDAPSPSPAEPSTQPSAKTDEDQPHE